MQVLTMPPPRAPAAEVLPDQAITAAIEELFRTKKGVAADQLGITTRAGIVALTGTTTSLLSRARAEEIALAVRGVRGVVNGVAVVPEAMPDEQLQRNVAQALAHDPATRDYNLRCTAAAGSVALTGMVQSWAEQQLALRVVQGVRGVRDIRAGRLSICWGERRRADAALTAQLRAVLDWDVRVNPRLVLARTTGHVVYLLGTVGSATEKARIVALAYEAGAAAVEAAALLVAAWAEEPHLPPGPAVPRPDDEVAQAVRDTLARNPRTQAFALLAHVREGVATLAGIVDSLSARQAAGHAARHVVGVWQVHNLLKVRPARSWSDAEVRRAILAALARDPYVGGATFTVNVLEGKAYLYGRVASHFEQAHARRLATNTLGVVAVESYLTARPPTLVAPPARRPAAAVADAAADHALAERIRARYFWSACLHSQAIAVRVAHGRATLTGLVDTWLARQLAAREAEEAGANEVNNHLVVRQLLGSV